MSTTLLQRLAMCRRLANLSVVTLLIGLMACETSGPSKLSLEDAKQVTLVFGTSTFVPPPRTLDDILKILDDQTLADLEDVAWILRMATREPRAGMEGWERANFFRQRGNANMELGKIRQALKDLREAERLSTELRSGLRSTIIEDLARLEIEIGNYRDAQRHLEEFLSLLPDSGKRGKRVGVYSQLARYHAWSGDIEGAEQFLSKAENALGGFMAFSRKARSKGPPKKGRVNSAKATVLDAKGEYAKAERYHLEVMAVLPVWGKTIERRENKRIEYAQNLYSQERFVEAEVIMRSILTARLFREGKYSLETVNVLHPMAELMSAEGRSEDAERLIRIVIDIYQQIGATNDSLWYARARADLGDALVAQQQWDDALFEFAAVEKILASDPETFQRVFARNPSMTIALLGTGRFADARIWAETAWTRNESLFGSKHYRTAESLGLLAAVQHAAGDSKASLSSYREAMPVLLSRSQQSRDENSTRTAKTQRLNYILERYLRLLSEIRGTPLERESGLDAVAESFRIADVARLQAVQGALVASAARAVVGSPELADLARREQDAQKQITALFGALAKVRSSPIDQQDSELADTLRRRVDDLRTARGVLMSEIEQQYPEYRRLVYPEPATVSSIQSALHSREALVALFVGEDRTYVWSIPARGAVSFATVPWSRTRMADVVQRLRLALDPGVSTLGDIPEFDVGLAHALYAALLGPVEAGLQGGKSLIVVPHGTLGQLPLSLLVTKPVQQLQQTEVMFDEYAEVAWLARDYALSVLPAAASLVSLRALPIPSVERRPFVGFGDPFFRVEHARTAQRELLTRSVAAPGDALDVRSKPLHLRNLPQTRASSTAILESLPRLPDTADEVRSMAIAVGADIERDVFLGERATEQSVKEVDLSNYQVLAFATHGLVPGDVDGLHEPALALSNPKLSNTKGDGLLTMGEILTLKLNADWVVLSACNTAAADGAGVEAFSGLGRAFFYAGTRAMLLSNWPVETTSAKALTTNLFKRQAKDPTLQRAEALRQSMLGLIDGPGFIDPKSNRAVFSYAHPIFWAPFSLVGDGGRSRPDT